jgi:hypothetical protein
MDLRNSIMEEVILKNYKLLQFVENEMKQLKDEIKLLKEENSYLKEEIILVKEDNTLLKKEIDNLQTKIDNSGIESNILVGYTGVNNPVYCNYNFDKECKSLPQLLYSWNCKILLKLSVFRQLSTYYNFNCVNLNDLCRTDNGQMISSINFVDELIKPKPIIISSYILYNGVALSSKIITFPLLDKLINILNECNIKLTLYYKYELYLDETNKINYRRITNSMINDFRGMNTGAMNDPSNETITIEQ